MGISSLVAAGATLVCGAYIAIALRLQNTHVLERDHVNAPHFYRHPILQAAFLLLGQSLCWALYALGPGRQQNEKGDNRVPWVQCGLIAAWDLGAILAWTWAMVLAKASVVTMLRGVGVVTTGAFSVLLLRRRLLTCHWVGCGLVILGVFLVGMSSVLFNTGGETEASEEPHIGGVLVLVSLTMVTLLYPLEARIPTRRSALNVLGIEGLLGCGLALLVLLIVGLAGGEDTIEGFQQFGAHPTLLLSSMGLILASFALPLCGIFMVVSHHPNYRNVADLLRGSLVWVYMVSIDKEDFQWMQWVGYGLVVVGSLFFFEIVPVPFAKTHRWRRVGQYDHDGLDVTEMEMEMEMGDETQPQFADLLVGHYRFPGLPACHI